MRTVEYRGCKLGCGGTHVEEIKEIKGVTIKELQKKKKNMRITYNVA